MLDGNALLFVGLQFGSRFANSFLVTAARYELLEAGGIAEFAGAQVATNVARMGVSQVAGVLTDNFALKHMYVATEACNLMLAIAMFFFGHGHGGILFCLNVGLGLVFAFSQPVTKSMPPAVVAAHEDLAIINGWDLTCDKVGRYLAPMAYAMVSSSFGFRQAVLIGTCFYGALALLRSLVRVSEPPAQTKTEGTSRATVGSKLWDLLGQVLDGFKSLRRDRILRLLILNTLVTNVFLYPLNSISFPILFKQIAEVSNQVDESVVGRILTGLIRLFGINKKKAWMNYTALVSLGGVVGPFLSNAMIYGLEAYSSQSGKCRLWVGVSFGISGQILTSAVLAVIMSLSWTLGSGLLAFALVPAWVVTIAVNNIVTTYFNSISQERLQRNERGRFIANLMTIFTLGSSLGTLLFGWVLSGDGRDVSGSVNLLLLGLFLKVVLLAMLAQDGAGSLAVGGLSADGKQKQT